VNIQTRHDPARPVGFRYSAIDSDTYDGAPDSKTRSQIGFGESEVEAIEDLKEQLESA